MDTIKGLRTKVIRLLEEKEVLQRENNIMKIKNKKLGKELNILREKVRRFKTSKFL